MEVSLDKSGTNNASSAPRVESPRQALNLLVRQNEISNSSPNLAKHAEIKQDFHNSTIRINTTGTPLRMISGGGNATFKPSILKRHKPFQPRSSQFAPLHFQENVQSSSDSIIAEDEEMNQDDVAAKDLQKLKPELPKPENEVISAHDPTFYSH